MTDELAHSEVLLGAACAILARRFVAAAPALDELQRLHLEAAAVLRADLPPLWSRVQLQLRTTAWPSAAAGVEWLQRAELELARRYTSLHDAGAAGAWQRYLRAERLLALVEFGELIPA
jgi:hypothetical protein